MQVKARASGKRIAGERPQRQKWSLYLRVLDAYSDLTPRVKKTRMWRIIGEELLECRVPDKHVPSKEFDRQEDRFEQAEARAIMHYKQACKIRDLLT